MAFNIQQKDDGQMVIKASEESQTKSVLVEFEPGVDVELGRGETDTDKTYIALRKEDGVKVYISAADNGTSVTVATTKP